MTSAYVTNKNGRSGSGAANFLDSRDGPVLDPGQRFAAGQPGFARFGVIVFFHRLVGQIFPEPFCPFADPDFR